MGKKARKIKKVLDNKLLFKRWIKLILSIYNGEKYYHVIREKDKKISINDSFNILQNQIHLIKMRMEKYNNLTLKNIENFTFLQNYII